ncbi:MAG TPA: CehA/McbA family metallohydrolase [bacterium]|nr:CehA/McbA family metallohydrolase [bacterium]
MNLTFFRRTFNIWCLALILFGAFLPGTARSAGEASLQVEMLDQATGERIPARVSLRDSAGYATPLPAQAVSVMYGRNDRAEGFGFQPDSAFYADGYFSLALKPGRYTIQISRGYEYLRQQHEIQLRAGQVVQKVYRLQRWIDMPERGWFSADDHIHIRRSPRENPHILKWISAEDIHVGVLLRMGDFWTTYYAQYAFGNTGLYGEGDHLLTSGQEDPRTHEVGHTISMAADSVVRLSQEYYLYDRVANEIHRLGGLFGYAHQGMSFHGYRGLTLDVLREKVDFLELLQFCVPEGPLALDHYYHFLDLGFAITATAGSDFPWCGKSRYTGGEPTWDAQIGNARFYTYTGTPFTFDAWKRGVKAGHTFVTSGPMLSLKVNGALPGDTVQVRTGEGITVTAEAYGHPSQVPLEDLEIVAHGEVVERRVSDGSDRSRTRLSLTTEIPVSQGMWIAARCQAGDIQVAHTTPVYVITEEGGFHNPATAGHYLTLSESYLQELEEVIAVPDTGSLNHHAWRYKQELDKRIMETRQIIRQLREEYIN